MVADPIKEPDPLWICASTRCELKPALTAVNCTLQLSFDPIAALMISVAPKYTLSVFALAFAALPPNATKVAVSPVVIIDDAGREKTAKSVSSAFSVNTLAVVVKYLSPEKVPVQLVTHPVMLLVVPTLHLELS